MKNDVFDNFHLKATLLRSWVLSFLFLEKWNILEIEITIHRSCLKLTNRVQLCPSQDLQSRRLNWKNIYSPSGILDFNWLLGSKSQRSNTSCCYTIWPYDVRSWDSNPNIKIFQRFQNKYLRIIVNTHQWHIMILTCHREKKTARDMLKEKPTCSQIIWETSRRLKKMCFLVWCLPTLFLMAISSSSIWLLRNFAIIVLGSSASPMLSASCLSRRQKHCCLFFPAHNITACRRFIKSALTPVVFIFRRLSSSFKIKKTWPDCNNL